MPRTLTVTTATDEYTMRVKDDYKLPQPVAGWFYFVGRDGDEFAVHANQVTAMAVADVVVKA